ncbi:hypothetical protein CR513_35341, partial [Mucuna pruriens]
MGISWSNINTNRNRNININRRRRRRKEEEETLTFTLHLCRKVTLLLQLTLVLLPPLFSIYPNEGGSGTLLHLDPNNPDHHLISFHFDALYDGRLSHFSLFFNNYFRSSFDPNFHSYSFYGVELQTLID